jgi:amino-acid N-acetyltransferase
MLIRAAQAGDLPSIIELLESCELPTDDIGEAQIDFLLAIDGGQIAGIAGLEPLGEIALLRSVAVSSNSRGLEVASRLCESLLESAAESGTQAVYLLTLDAADYFSRMGFEPVERSSVPMAVQETAEFSQLCPTSATVMCRRVQAAC